MVRVGGGWNTVSIANNHAKYRPTSLSDPSASTRDISEDEIRAKEKHDADRKQCVKDRAKHSQKQKQCHDSDSDNVCTPLLIDGVELDDMGALSSENMKN